MDRGKRVDRTLRWRAVACAAGAVVAAVIATGCSGGQAPNSPGGARPAAAAGTHGGAAARAAADAKATAPAVRIPVSVPNSATARRAVTLTSCTATRTGGRAAGMVTTLGKRAATYTITVFFTTSQATVIDYGSTKVYAAPGKATPWAISAHFEAPHGMRCVLRGVTATS